MRSKIFRTTIFTLHRCLGLFAGLILVIVGITGSLLVFRQEWDDWLVRWRFGTVAAASPPLDIELLVRKVAKLI